MEMRTSTMSRRSLLTFGGTSLLLAGCQVSPDMIGALAGGSGKDADWGSLIKSFHAALDKVADQTEELIKVQLSYAEVFGLKKRAAYWKGQAIAAKNGRSGLKFAELEKQSKSQQKEISSKLGKSASVSAAGKRKLESGMKRHKKAVENAWVGAAMILKVVIDAQSAKKPTFKDLEAVKYLAEIVKDGPMAIKFVETSKSTYEAYSDAFEFKAKVRVPSKPKLAPMKSSMKRG